MDLETGLHLAQGDVLAHLQLDQVLLSVDDLKGSMLRKLSDVTCG